MQGLLELISEYNIADEDGGYNRVALLCSDVNRRGKNKPNSTLGLLDLVSPEQDPDRPEHSGPWTQVQLLKGVGRPTL